MEIRELARQVLADRLLAHLMLLDNDHGGFAVDRLEHSLQTATRAHRDGRDEEYVVCTLIHDIGDILLPANHAPIQLRHAEGDPERRILYAGGHLGYQTGDR